MIRMDLQHSRVIEAEGEWEEMLQVHAQQFLAREQAEYEEVMAQEEAEAKEMEARARDKREEEAIKDIRYLFGDDNVQDESEEDISPREREWLDAMDLLPPLHIGEFGQ